MQIGKGKQGILIGEYEGSTVKNTFLGYLEPACDNPQWILWFDAKGDAQLYTQREYSKEHQGAVIGDPIRLKARGRGRNTDAPQASITGNMEVGRTKINGEDFLTVKVDKHGGNLKWIWPDGDVNEIKFGKTGDGHDYEGRDPEDCVNLEGRTNTIVLVNPHKHVI